MKTLKTIGIIGSAAALVLSANMVFAKGPSEDSSRGNQENENRVTLASTTREESRENDTEIKRQKAEERLSDIQDKTKQQLAKRLATQFVKLNSSWTSHFTKLLDRYDTIVQKIENRATIAANAGKDIATTTAAIQSAKAAIAAARVAVAAQAAKTFILPTPTPSTATTTAAGQIELLKAMKTSFQDLHKTLFSDLFALRDGQMKAARKAVQDAIQTLGKISGVDDEKEGNATTTKSND